MTFLTEAWFWRGTQSAVFYYLSCAPCSRISTQRRQRREAKRAGLERADDGGPQQPLPSGTNPYWDEEICLGPGPPPRRATKSSRTGANKRAAGPAAAPSLEMEEAKSYTTDASPTSSGTRIELVPHKEWNRCRYQREDEELWGLEATTSGTSLDGSQTQIGSLNKATRCLYGRNPEVNDLHPPVVSRPATSKHEAQWMLQPPPRARIMEGKEPVSRTRSHSSNTSAASRRVLG